MPLCPFADSKFISDPVQNFYLNFLLIHTVIFSNFAQKSATKTAISFRREWRDSDIAVQGHDHVSGYLLALQYENAQNLSQPRGGAGADTQKWLKQRRHAHEPNGNLSYSLQKFLLVLRGMEMKH